MCAGYGNLMDWCRGSILSENSQYKCVSYVEANYRCAIATAVTSIVVVLY